MARTAIWARRLILFHRYRDDLRVFDTVRRLVETQARGEEGEGEDGRPGARQQNHESQHSEADVDPERGEVVMGGAADSQIKPG